MISISDVRLAVGDTPRRKPEPGQRALVLGVGDNVSTSFFLPSPFIYNGSITVFTKTSATSWQQADASTYQFIAPDTIQFNYAPDVTQEIGASFLTAAFQDSDLALVLASAQAQFSTDDLVIKKCQYDITGYYLLDRSRLRYLHEGDFSDDPTVWARALNQLRKDLVGDLTGKIQANSNIPSVVVTHGDYESYAPPR